MNNLIQRRFSRALSILILCSSGALIFCDTSKTDQGALDCSLLSEKQATTDQEHIENQTNINMAATVGPPTGKETETAEGEKFSIPSEASSAAPVIFPESSDLEGAETAEGEKPSITVGSPAGKETETAEGEKFSIPSEASSAAPVIFPESSDLEGAESGTLAPGNSCEEILQRFRRIEMRDQDCSVDSDCACYPQIPFDSKLAVAEKEAAAEMQKLADIYREKDCPTIFVSVYPTPCVPQCRGGRCFR